MINVNTLKYLDDVGIGININKIESYIVDYMKVLLVCDTYDYKYHYNKLYDILKEIKPDSYVFTDSVLLEEEKQNDYDKLFIDNGEYKITTRYGINYIKNTQWFSDICDSGSNLVSMPNINGINIKCTYINGYLGNINIIAENKKYTDITDLVRCKLPRYIPEIHNKSLVELRGKLVSMSGYDNNIMLPEANIMHSVRLHNIDDLNIVFHNIYSTDSELNELSLWKKLEYIDSINLNTINHLLLNKITKNNLYKAFETFDEKFYSDCLYNYNGIIIYNENTKDYILYKNRIADYEKVFSSSIKKIQYTSDKLYILINTMNNINDKVSIDRIYVDDIDKLNKYNDNEVKFIVVNNKAILC